MASPSSRKTKRLEPLILDRAKPALPTRRLGSRAGGAVGARSAGLGPRLRRAIPLRQRAEGAPTERPPLSELEGRWCPTLAATPGREEVRG